MALPKYLAPKNSRDNEIIKFFNGMSDTARNRIDLFICEEALKIFSNHTEYRTFSLWCDNLNGEVGKLINSSVHNKWAPSQMIEVQVQLIEAIMEIFGFDIDEAYYVVKYFITKKLYLEFEEVAKESFKIFYAPTDTTFKKANPLQG